jgi:nicotinic acid mononucleotide adenylyltransferase
MMKKLPTSFQFLDVFGPNAVHMRVDGPENCDENILGNWPTSSGDIRFLKAKNDTFKTSSVLPLKTLGPTNPLLHVFFEANRYYFNTALENTVQDKLSTQLNRVWDGLEHLCVFPGSFNPWHKGHRNCLDLFRERSKTPLWIIPDCNPDKNIMPSVLETLHPLLPLLDQVDFHLVPNFLLNGVANPTYLWLPRLKARLPQLKTLSLLLGADSLLNLPNWRHPELLLPAISEIFWVSRDIKKQAVEESIKKIKLIAPAIAVTWLGHHQHEKLSSSDLRGKGT